MKRPESYGELVIMEALRFVLMLLLVWTILYWWNEHPLLAWTLLACAVDRYIDKLVDAARRERE